MRRPKKNPFERKYRQLATDSRTAIKIAAAPPYKRNARKTEASEKLMANRDLGNCKLILGAIKVAKTIRSRKLQFTAAEGRVASAITVHATPAKIVVPFVRFERVSLVISGEKRSVFSYMKEATVTTPPT